MTTTTIAICTDCLMALANDEWPDEQREGEPVPLALIAGEDVTLGDVDGADDLGFSWHDCQGCGSRLGGDRFAATVWS